jgi:hypothetical protein
MPAKKTVTARLRRAVTVDRKQGMKEEQVPVATRSCSSFVSCLPDFLT